MNDKDRMIEKQLEVIKTLTRNNMRSLACVGLNDSGKKFCRQQGRAEGAVSLDGKEGFIIR